MKGFFFPLNIQEKMEMDEGEFQKTPFPVGIVKYNFKILSTVSALTVKCILFYPQEVLIKCQSET